jgi:4-amino-4-deoxy-L-arabinose transferase-like glycosyltransferase
MLLALPRTGHVDDSDANVYRVVVRNMVADHTWLDLRYLPHVHPRFREHLPFGFWPAAAAVRVFGEGAIPVVGGLETLLLLVTVAWLTQRLSDGFAGAVAFVILGTAESIFVLGPTARLDPLLLLLTTLSAVPFLARDMGRRALWLGIACTALATLVKGPFGLLPWCCASAARAIVERRWSPLRWGVLGAVSGVMPVAVFLACDRAFGDGTWWNGYGHAQLLASAIGTRTDGVWPFWYPLYVVAGRFWPGLPFAALGLYLAAIWRGHPERVAGALQILALSCVLMLLGLMLPARKAWSHSLVVFPLLGALGGMGMRSVLKISPVRALRFIERGVAGLCVVLLAAIGLGLGARLWKPRCVASGPLHAELTRLSPGTPVAVVSESPSWLTVGTLADELRLSPAPAVALSDVTPAFDWAVVEEAHWLPTPAWHLVKAGGGWVLLERTGPER